MKAISRRAAIFLLLLGNAPAWGADSLTVAGPWVELRKAPLFGAEPLALAKTWGPTIPVGDGFQAEKIYGRWIFGRPAPLKHMKTGDFAPAGWIFGRMLLTPGDADTLPPSLVKRAHGVLFHARSAWKKLGLCKLSPCSPLDFLEGLTLSTKTLSAFSASDEESEAAASAFSLFPTAGAAEEEEAPPMGLAGTEMKFLDQEIHTVQTQKQSVKKKKIAATLAVPPAPPLDAETRTALLGRFMLERYLELPPLSMEEVDGFLYMRATAMRALAGCPKEIRDYWKNRRWNFFRVFGLRSRPEDKHPWFEISLPGGYFALSGRAIERAGNEGELAFLLVRQLVREPRVKRHLPKLSASGWPQSLESASEEYWDNVLRAQSTRESENLDVAVEIAVDLTAAECISQAGYRPLSGIAYLRKLAVNRDQPWAGWLNHHLIGIDYRIERGLTLVQEALAKQSFHEGPVVNAKRFSTAAKLWNILP
jgi:hypothetical protein